jgi:hypothetical protein
MAFPMQGTLCMFLIISSQEVAYIDSSLPALCTLLDSLAGMLSEDAIATNEKRKRKKRKKMGSETWFECALHLHQPKTVISVPIWHISIEFGSLEMFGYAYWPIILKLSRQS